MSASLWSGIGRGSLYRLTEASEPHFADRPVESMPVIGSHSAGFLRQEVHEFASMTSVPPAQLAHLLRELRNTSNYVARCACLDRIAALWAAFYCGLAGRDFLSGRVLGFSHCTRVAAATTRYFCAFSRAARLVHSHCAMPQCSGGAFALRFGHWAGLHL